MKIMILASASVSLPVSRKIMENLVSRGHQACLILTNKAMEMLDESGDTFKKSVYKKMDGFQDKAAGEWIFVQNGSASEWTYGREVREYEDHGKVWHVDAGREYDALLVAPATMDVIGRTVQGISGEPALDMVSVFLGSGKPVWFAPAMNTGMWKNPFVQANLEVLKGVLKGRGGVIPPDVKRLACGDYGIGALADAGTICDLVCGRRWLMPFPDIVDFPDYLPRWYEPGAFGALRKHDVHQGVDVYASEGKSVRAVEDGTVAGLGRFTGESVGCGWWNDTDYLAVKGDSGTVVYGEIKVSGKLDIESKVKAGDVVGTVMTVCKEDPKQPVRNHLNSMLHLELYKGIEHSIDIEWGRNGGGYGERPIGLTDPTPYLMFSTP